MAAGIGRDSFFSIDNLAGTVTDITPQLTNIEFSTDKGVPDVTTMGFNYHNYLPHTSDT